MAYTKGPWRYSEGDCAIISETAKNDWDGEPIQVVDLLGAMGGDESEGDICLIAAAPDLLEALETVQRTAGWLFAADELQELVEAAIAKAKGGAQGRAGASADNDMRDRMAARRGDFEVCPVGTGARLNEAVEALKRMADAYECLCGDTNKRYDQSPTSVYAYARAVLAKIEGKQS